MMRRTTDNTLKPPVSAKANRAPKPPKQASILPDIHKSNQDLLSLNKVNS